LKFKNLLKNDTYVLGALNGRFDHTISNLSTLYKIPLNKHVYLISNESVVFLLNRVRKNYFFILNIFINYYHN